MKENEKGNDGRLEDDIQKGGHIEVADETLQGQIHEK